MRNDHKKTKHDHREVQKHTNVSDNNEAQSNYEDTQMGSVSLKDWLLMCRGWLCVWGLISHVSLLVTKQFLLSNHCT